MPILCRKHKEVMRCEFVRCCCGFKDKRRITYTKDKWQQMAPIKTRKIHTDLPTPSNIRHCFTSCSFQKRVCSGRIFFFTKAKIDRCCGDHKKQNKDQKQGSVEGETGFAHIHFNSFALHIIPKQTIKREPADRSAVFVV